MSGKQSQSLTPRSAKKQSRPSTPRSCNKLSQEQSEVTTPKSARKLKYKGRTPVLPSRGGPAKCGRGSVLEQARARYAVLLK